jgi:hypothetical protein
MSGLHYLQMSKQNGQKEREKIHTVRPAGLKPWRSFSYTTITNYIPSVICRPPTHTLKNKLRHHTNEGFLRPFCGSLVRWCEPLLLRDPDWTSAPNIRPSLAAAVKAAPERKSRRRRIARDRMFGVETSVRIYAKDLAGTNRKK